MNMKAESAPDVIQNGVRKPDEKTTGGIKDPEAARKSLEAMTRIRELQTQKYGLRDIAVPMVREARNGQ